MLPNISLSGQHSPQHRTPLRQAQPGNSTRSRPSNISCTADTGKCPYLCIDQLECSGIRGHREREREREREMFLSWRWRWSVGVRLKIRLSVGSPALVRVAQPVKPHRCHHLSPPQDLPVMQDPTCPGGQLFFLPQDLKPCGTTPCPAGASSTQNTEVTFLSWGGFLWRQPAAETQPPHTHTLQVATFHSPLHPGGIAWSSL
jgi:hypothetical protein